MFIRRSTVWKRQLCRRDPPIFVPKYLPKVVVQPPPLHTHLLYERFHDWPHLPLVTLSFPRKRLECCGLVGVWLNSLLQSHVALLSPQLRCELLESMDWVSGFSHNPKSLHGAALSREAQQGLLFGPDGHVSTWVLDSRAHEAPTQVTQGADWL